MGHKCYKIMELDGLYISSCNGKKINKLINLLNLFLDMGFWDTVAGHCLLHEIGGGFYYFNGDMVKYDISNGKNCMKDYFIICASQEKLRTFLEVKNKNLKYFQDNFNV